MASTNFSAELLAMKREIQALKGSNWVKVARQMIDEAFDQTFPVGSILTTYDDTNPGTRMSGTWEQFATGKTIIGVDSKDNDFKEAGNTGGAKTISLSESQMPSHSHSGTTDTAGGNDIPLRGYGSTLGSGSTGWRFGSGGSSSATGIASLPSHTHKFETNAAGSGKPIDKLPPYVTAYFWRRVK